MKTHTRHNQDGSFDLVPGPKPTTRKKQHRDRWAWIALASLGAIGLWAGVLLPGNQTFLLVVSGMGATFGIVKAALPAKVD